jgi:hypothetical protein
MGFGVRGFSGGYSEARRHEEQFYSKKNKAELD